MNIGLDWWVLNAHCLRNSGVSWLRRAVLPRVSHILQFLYNLFTKQRALEPLAPHGSGGRSARWCSDASIPLQIDYKIGHLMTQEADVSTGFSDTSIPLQTDYKIKHFGASGASCLRRPIRQILFPSHPPCKTETLQPRAPHGSRGRSAKSFPNSSNPLKTLHKRSTL